MTRLETYGNSSDYLTARIARDRPDILERMQAGEFKSTRAAAIEAGIVTEMHDDDRRINDLFVAWRKADLIDRQIFLTVLGDEVAAALDGDYVQHEYKKPGRQPVWLHEDAPVDLRRLIEGGKSSKYVAEAIGVSRRTVMRWRLGQTKPSQKHLDKLCELIGGAG